MGISKLRALLLILGVTVVSIAGAKPPDRLADPGRPGYFRLIRSNNEGVCRLIVKLVNEDISRKQNINFKAHDIFLKWNFLSDQEISDPSLREIPQLPLEKIEVDVDGDGTIDRIIKTGFTFPTSDSESKEQLMLILSRSGKDLGELHLTKSDLFNSGMRINFDDTKFWGKHFEKYKNDFFKMQDWLFFGPAEINVFQIAKKTYFFASDYYPIVAPESSAQIYVFQVIAEGQIEDVCMFRRICSCKGCVGSENGDIKENPALRFCGK